MLSFNTVHIQHYPLCTARFQSASRNTIGPWGRLEFRDEDLRFNPRTFVLRGSGGDSGPDWRLSKCTAAGRGGISPRFPRTLASRRGTHAESPPASACMEACAANRAGNAARPAAHLGYAGTHQPAADNRHVLDDDFLRRRRSSGRGGHRAHELPGYESHAADTKAATATRPSEVLRGAGTRSELTSGGGGPRPPLRPARPRVPWRQRRRGWRLEVRPAHWPGPERDRVRTEERGCRAHVGWRGYRLLAGKGAWSRRRGGGEGARGGEGRWAHSGLGVGPALLCRAGLSSERREPLLR